jgi:hypothetical protein
VERGRAPESLLDRLKANETERCRLRQDQVLLEAAIGSRRATFLGAREVAELLGELRQQQESENTQESRAMLKMICERVVVGGEIVTVHCRPEAELWFRTADEERNRLYLERETSRVWQHVRSGGGGPDPAGSQRAQAARHGAAQEPAAATIVAVHCQAARGHGDQGGTP